MIEIVSLQLVQTHFINKGNVEELLKFRMKSSDKILDNHLKTTHAKATYINNTIQEELIECRKKEIIHKISYISIIFDETSDVTYSPHMTLVLRYIFDGKIKEDCVSFIICHTYYYSKQK